MRAAYSQERRRLLENSVCRRRCERQYGWSHSGRKHYQRELLKLRVVWSAYFAAQAQKAA